METDQPRSLEGRSDLRLAADIGGTFTDVAAFEPATGRIRFSKVPSSSHAPADGVMAGIEKTGAACAGASLFLHGSTVVINTIVERTGARTALIVTEGFRDIYEIGRINRPDAYNLFFRRHTPLVERALRFEVRERVLADSGVDIPLDDGEIAALGKRLAALGVEAVAILFLNAYRNPSHEARAKALLAANHPDMFVSASHELSREYGEFERCSTVAANAYVGPRASGYLDDVTRRLARAGFGGSVLTAQSTGGLCDAAQAAPQGIRMLESGPAAGVIGARALCRALAIDNAVAFDMGGTTAKAGVIRNGEPLMAGVAPIGGDGRALPVLLPMIDIIETGIGGGAIARAEDGALRVGPLSAGADPGPACYGRGGTAATVTDANLALGRLDAGRFLNGEMPLDEKAARTAIMTRVAGPLNLDLTAAAGGIVRIAAAATSYAISRIATEHGFDPGDFTLVAYGGAGPLHAMEIARELGIRRVIIPPAPGMFSAFGLLHADLRHDGVRTWPVRLDDAAFEDLGRLYGEMEDEGRRAIAGAAVRPDEVTVSRTADMRCAGHERTVAVDLPMPLFEDRDRDAIRRRFDDAHLRRYGVSASAERAEIVSLRTTVTGIMPKPVFAETARGGVALSKAARAGTRSVWFDGSFVDTRIVARDALVAGNRIKGPAVIEEYASTTVLAPGDTAEVDRFGNLVVATGKRKT